MSVTDGEKTPLPNGGGTPAEYGVKVPEDKARNRLVSEGYKYQAYDDNGTTELLAPVEEEAETKRRRRYNRILWLLLFSVVMIVCLVVVIIFQFYKPVAMCDQKCMSPSCVQDAAYILNKMDITKDPCDDFFEFSCGNWVKNTKIPASKPKYGAFQQLQEDIELDVKKILEQKGNGYKGVNSSAIHKVKAYYNMCMDELTLKATGNRPMFQYIKTLGSWTFTSDNISGTFDPDRWNVQDAVLLAQQRNVNPFFGMSVSADSKNTSKNIIQFSQTGLTLSDPREYLSDNKNYAKMKEALISFMTAVLKRLGAKGDLTDKVTALYNLEKQMAESFVPRNQLLDPVKIYHKMSLQEFQDNYVGDWLNLTLYIEGMFKEVATVPMTTQVVIITPSYFKKLNAVVKGADKETLANYVVWRGVESKLGYLTDDFLKDALILDQAETGVTTYPPRWKRCQSKVSSALGFATGALYVQAKFSEDSKTEVKALFEEIRAAFIANLDNVAWMDTATRSYAREKAQAVTEMLGYPDYITDPKLLDQHYENLTIVEGDFFATKLSITRHYRLFDLQDIGKPPDPTRWSMVPTTVNGYYAPDYNHVAFPAGILQPPLFSLTVPKPFNFGSFGMISGHELTHGFDNQGKNYDKHGILRNWWTNSSALGFQKHTKCFVDFYSNYKVNGVHLDGNHTLNENIADNGGMKLAFQAYLAWKSKTKDDTVSLPGLDFNGDQLFFIGMSQIWCSYYRPEYMQLAILTDPHSIAKYRVLGAMSNSKYFAQTFNCPLNSPMNPAKKCSVW